MEKWVEIWIPGVEGSRLVTETSFRKLHEPKGYMIVLDDPEDDDDGWEPSPVDLEEDQTEEVVE